jgi:hypothetical protein
MSKEKTKARSHEIEIRAAIGQISGAINRITSTMNVALADEWTCGFGLALAEVNRRCSQKAAIREVCKAAGIHHLNTFKDAGLGPYDLRELRKCFK